MYFILLSLALFTRASTRSYQDRQSAEVVFIPGFDACRDGHVGEVRNVVEVDRGQPLPHPPSPTGGQVLAVVLDRRRRLSEPPLPPLDHGLDRSAGRVPRPRPESLLRLGRWARPRLDDLRHLQTWHYTYWLNKKTRSGEVQLRDIQIVTGYYNWDSRCLCHFSFLNRNG